MKEKTGRRGIAANRIPFERFVRLFGLIEAALVFLYAKWFASFSVYGIRLWVLITIAAALAGGNLILSWKWERNWISLISGTLLPVLAYEAASLWKYFTVVRILLLAGGFVSAAVGLLWAARKGKQLQRVRRRRARFVANAAFAARILCCLALLGACICGKVLIASHCTVRYSDIAYTLSEAYNDIPDYENSLAANIATVAKIDPDGGWGSLSLEEKRTVLETVVRVECRYLGMQDSAPAFALAHLEEDLLGQYDSEADTVTLSYRYVVDSNASGYSVVQVLCHELYHRYQHYQVKLLQAIRSSDATAKYAGLLMLDAAGIYEDELRSYISPDDGSVLSYSMYRAQRLERDAETYGNASVADYFEQIRSYLKAN